MSQAIHYFVMEKTSFMLFHVRFFLNLKVHMDIWEGGGRQNVNKKASKLLPLPY